jgi:TonB-linked SusC/RagA family outer membrane protein
MNLKLKAKVGLKVCCLPAKIPLFMKLTLVLLLTAMLQATAGVHAQKVTLYKKNATLLEVLKSIRKQTGCHFVGDKEMLQSAGGININVANSSLDEAMVACLDDLPFSYTIIDKTIVIKEKEARIQPVTVKSLADTSITITGKVTDSLGVALPGVSVILKTDPKKGVQTGPDGRYTFITPTKGILVFTFIGYQRKEVAIDGKSVKNVVLSMSDSQLGEVAVVAFGTQKKTSMVGAVTTINPKELKGPTSNMTTMLAGRVAGVISVQRSGEPGKDNADFFIRGVTSFGTGKVNPLILIDGMESNTNELARIQPDDVASFSILKDATASSLYGARGANGVVLVTTKSGTKGKTKFLFRVENSVSSNTKNYKLADNIAFMNMANEAALTRDPLSPMPYAQSKIDHTAAGDNPLLYPNNDWMKMMIKDNTSNQRYNLSLDGGNELGQYYISGTYNVDNGVLKSVPGSSFNSNVRVNNFELRSNVNIKLTPTTDAIVRTSGQFSDYNGPVGGGGAVFAQVVSANPVAFPIMYPQSMMPDVKHPLFGNAKVGGGLYNNPYANTVSGFQQETSSTLTAQIELKQNLRFITPGLSARAMGYTKRYAYFDVRRSYNPFYYAADVDPDEGVRGLTLLNETSATEFLSYNPGAKTINTLTYMEAALSYNKTIQEDHEISAMLITILNNSLTANAGSLQASLPHRNQGLSGRLTYDYKHRYMTEFNFGYNGSERFHKTHRYGFFPSVGVGWNLSNEAFWEPIKREVSNFKLRATYGLVGNDQIGNENDRFFYLSNVNMNDGDKGYSFGENYNTYKPGISVTRYENNDISWEKAYKTDIGMELEMRMGLKMEVDFFREHRTNILMSRSFVPSSMGLNAGIQANVGEVEGKGVDLSLDYSKYFGKHTFVKVMGNFTYAGSKILAKEEPNYPDGLKYLSAIGNPVGYETGLIAERYFIDEHEVANSPRQSFGNYMAGDLKYRDMNGDGQITDLDKVPIGFPTVPQITYGFGFTVGYKAFLFSAFFQGSARTSLHISPNAISPFVSQHGLLEVINQDHWSESNRDLYAFWPRLSTENVANNERYSTWWMRDGTFLRAKTMELSYLMPTEPLRKIHLSYCRLYLNGLNLFSLSKFKLWDVEMGGNGLGYPVQRVINVGVNLGF